MIVYSVCYLAKVFAESLRDQFLKDYDTSDQFDPEEVLCAQIAGLCHDLGRQIMQEYILSYNFACFTSYITIAT